MISGTSAKTRAWYGLSLILNCLVRSRSFGNSREKHLSDGLIVMSARASFAGSCLGDNAEIIRREPFVESVSNCFGDRRVRVSQIASDVVGECACREHEFAFGVNLILVVHHTCPGLPPQMSPPPLLSSRVP